jgi:cytochrome c553
MKTFLIMLGLTAMLAAADGAAIYKSQCASCHGAAGEKKALNKSQVIKDFSKEQIVTALKGYKDGSYGGAMKALMKGQAAKLSDADIEAVAEAIASK